MMLVRYRKKAVRFVGLIWKTICAKNEKKISLMLDGNWNKDGLEGQRSYSTPN